ncbi:MAG TPA: hypothetical protein VK922_15175 [Gemmatimonadaceae bacterium]|nr:hypothetical protein [Gemmatimonadaceae bacterium]
MRKLSVVTLTAAIALAACNPFNRGPVTEVSRDANANSRWNASLVTPVALAGAVQMNGTGSMQPGVRAENTALSLRIANATPGGVHPWQVQRGQCGSANQVFGPVAAYQALKIDDDGRGQANATISERTPTWGDYSVVVYASAANAETVVACGNLAPPAR